MKERLTGAIILVALIVLLVPELLTGPIRSSPRPRPAASSAEEPPLRSYTINLGDDAHARSNAATNGPQQPIPLAAAAPAVPAAAAQTAPAAAPPAARTAAPPLPAPAAPVKSTSVQSMPAKAAPARVAAAKATPAKAAAKATADPAAAAGSGAWMVQLGSFARRANAERLAQQLRDGGFRVSVSQGRSGRHLYRVQVGPAHDRATAGQLAAKLQAAGHSGSIVPR